MKKLLVLFLVCYVYSAEAQQDSAHIRNIYNEVLKNGKAYSNLSDLCLNVGHRLSGSPQAEKAVQWGFEAMKAAGADTVYLQPVQVPVWTRGNKENVGIIDGKVKKMLKACSLGGSVGTNGVLTSQIIEVEGIEGLKKLDDAAVKGKIVFFNKPMDPTRINTFEAYGGCVDQRHAGAGQAAQKGAVAVLVRSMSLAIDEHPHTGSMHYPDGVNRIPALAISTADAEWLHQRLTDNKSNQIKASIESNCEFMGYAQSFNVIGELRGSEKPGLFMVSGGHLDSWDKGQGAHDDGAGCVQAIEVMRLFTVLGLRPRHTFRAILFMNEENGNMGGNTYADTVNNRFERHILAFESDRGGFSPRGVHMDADPEDIAKIDLWRTLLEPYGLHVFEKGYAGVDISPLKNKKGSVNPNIIMMGLLPDSQRYFDYHHAETDVITNVNPRELHLGAGSMAAIIYLFDKYYY